MGDLHCFSACLVGDHCVYGMYGQIKVSGGSGQVSTPTSENATETPVPPVGAQQA